MSDGAMLLLMLVTFVTAVLMNGPEPILPLLIRKRFDFAPLYLGLTYMALPVAFVVSSPIVGWLSDRCSLAHFPHKFASYMAADF